jgi:cation diffusion facilitator CzcD-associated flavoprotein CzcO
VRGTVFDAQGAVVPSATVTVRNPATGTARDAVTSQEGIYQVLSLNPGTYTVEVVAPGFNKVIADQVVVTVGYTNASWTLKAELSSLYVCRLLNYMDRHGWRTAIPQLVEGSIGEQPMISLTSGYATSDRSTAQARFEEAVDDASKLSA